MTNIAFIIYRKWGYEIFKNIKAFEKTHPFFTVITIITTPECEFDYPNTHLFEVDGNDNKKIYEILSNKHVDIAFFYGWSWIVREPLLSCFMCLCLHPSPLPKYRGGTPLQHQIINGEKQSAVSVIRMSKGIDDGDIYMQKPLSLQGSIQDIFKRMVIGGTEITQQFLNDYQQNRVKFTPQHNLETNPPLKRRKPQDCIFSLEQLLTFSYEYLFNCVRALTKPYPNVIIDNGKIQISVSKIQRYSHLPLNSLRLNKDIAGGDLTKVTIPLFVQLKQGYAKLVEFTVN